MKFEELQKKLEGKVLTIYNGMYTRHNGKVELFKENYKHFKIDKVTEKDGFICFENLSNNVRINLSPNTAELIASGTNMSQTCTEKGNKEYKHRVWIDDDMYIE